MRTEFQEYLREIGVEGAFLERADAILAHFEVLVPDLVAEATLFVSDRIDEEGKRRYASLWLFTAEAMMEAKEFLEKVDIDFAPLTNGCVYWVINTRSFSLKETTDASRMSLRVILPSDVGGELQATGSNCAHLLDVLRQYILPL